MIMRPVLLAAVPALVAAQSPSLVAPPARVADSILTDASGRGFAGVVLAWKDGAPVLRKGYGLAQRESRTAFSPQTIVQVGSNTKDFTAVAILQLMVAGKLRVEDSIARFFPDAPADKRGITVRQLLNHRSGLPIGIGPDPELVSRDEFRKRIYAVKLQSAPGSAEQYSNAGFSLLALIIEQLSGQSYDAYVRDKIFAPSGMTSTGYSLPGFDRARVAHGYSGSEDRGTILDFPHPADGASWTLRGNGGMLSTVDDMAAFYRTLFTTEKLLPAEARNRRFDPNDAAVLAGSDLTSYFVFQHEPMAHLDLIVASNSSTYPAPRLMRPLAASLGVTSGPDVARGGGEMAPAVAIPDTPAGATIKAYIAMFNAADSAKADAFFRDRTIPRAEGPPPGVRAARTQAMANDLGALTPIAYTVEPDGRVIVRVRGSTGDVGTFTFDIEPDPPHRIRALGVSIGG